MSERRITVEEAKAAYTKIGAAPITKCFIGRRRGGFCGCPVGVLYCAEEIGHPVDGTYGAASNWSTRTFGRDYIFAFESGFDSGEYPVERTEREEQGFADGLACRREILLTGWRPGK